jgi:hypothetical protein
MGLSATYWILCDLCGDDSGAGKPTQEEAWDHVQRGDWWVNKWYGAAVCEECFDPEAVYHAQNLNVSCVLCLSGEHIAIRK